MTIIIYNNLYLKLIYSGSNNAIKMLKKHHKNISFAFSQTMLPHRYVSMNLFRKVFSIFVHNLFLIFDHHLRNTLYMSLYNAEIIHVGKYNFRRTLIENKAEFNFEMQTTEDLNC